MRMLAVLASKIALALVTLLLALFVGEGLLRLMGFEPVAYEAAGGRPAMHEQDSTLGWRNKEGSYLVQPYSPSGVPIHVNFLERGRRRTGAGAPGHTKGDLVLVGGSFSQGWAISDEETFAYKLQKGIPSLRVLNYGTGGYGSLQSLLVLEQELPLLSAARIVLYGFVQHHEVRNVAHYSWLRAVSSQSDRGHLFVPYATLDERDELVRHPPERYVSLPLEESSATISLMELAYMRLKTRGRWRTRRQVTEKILLEMDEVSRDHGSAFFVVFLAAGDATKKSYMTFLGENVIRSIDCAYDFSSEYQVEGDGHPNGRMNTRWAQCILAALRPELEGSRLARLPLQSTPLDGVTRVKKPNAS
jgi:hypothetical protein